MVPTGWMVSLAGDTRVNRRTRDARLRQLLDLYLDFVARVLRNLGTPEADVDDGVQKTFLVLAERLEEVRPGSEKAFLFQTAANVAAHVRRTLARRREVSEEGAPERIEDTATPDALMDQKRARALLDRVLDALDEDVRTVFVLFELQELTMAEIATLLGLPPGTVASRLRRGRADFKAEVERLQRATAAKEAS